LNLYCILEVTGLQLVLHLQKEVKIAWCKTGKVWQVTCAQAAPDVQCIIMQKQSAFGLPHSGMLQVISTSLYLSLLTIASSGISLWSTMPY